jgi:2,2-dialkylglycine decarboxylase (pyruvate)
MHAIPEPNAYRCPIEHCRDRCDMTCLKVGLQLFDMQSAGAPAALIAEPILSAGGVIVPPEGYFDRVQEACRARGLMLIFDEAQTAFGRIGAGFAASKLGVVPDIMTVSKTLGGGIPLAATITSDEIEARAHDKGFAHYTSHVSDPLPAAVGLAVIETIERERLIDRRRAGDRSGEPSAAPHLGRPHDRALPRAGPQHEYPPPAGARLGLAHRPAAHGHPRGDR